MYVEDDFSETHNNQSSNGLYHIMNDARIGLMMLACRLACPDGTFSLQFYAYTDSKPVTVSVISGPPPRKKKNYLIAVNSIHRVFI